MQHSMAVMDHTGHSEISWDPDDADSVASARAIFDSVRAKGHSIFRVKGKGKIGERLTAFDPSAERLTVVPHLVGG